MRPSTSSNRRDAKVNNSPSVSAARVPSGDTLLWISVNRWAPREENSWMSDSRRLMSSAYTVL